MPGSAAADAGRLPAAELTETLMGARLDGLAGLPRTVFLPRPVDDLEISALAGRPNRSVGSGVLLVAGPRGVWRLHMVRTDAGAPGLRA